MYICPSIYASVHFVCLPLCFSISLSTYLFIYFSFLNSLSVCLSVCLSVSIDLLPNFHIPTYRTTYLPLSLFPISVTNDLPGPENDDDEHGPEVTRMSSSAMSPNGLGPR